LNRQRWTPPNFHAAQQDLLQFQAARLLNAIALYRSLGGGWKS
jgi:outer membrane protein TolC